MAFSESPWQGEIKMAKSPLPFLCAHSTEKSKWLHRPHSGLCNMLCKEGMRCTAVYLGGFPK